MVPRKYIKSVVIICRSIAVICIGYWASIVLYSKKAFQRFPEVADAITTIRFMGLEFSPEQLNAIGTILLLPIGVFLWVFADHQSHQIEH